MCQHARSYPLVYVRIGKSCQVYVLLLDKHSLNAKEYLSAIVRLLELLKCWSKIEIEWASVQLVVEPWPSWLYREQEMKCTRLVSPIFSRLNQGSPRVGGKLCGSIAYFARNTGC